MGFDYLGAAKLGVDVLGGIAGGVGRAKESKANAKEDARRAALDRYDSQRQTYRDNALDDSDRSYRRAQQAALNPVRGQLYSMMLGKMGVGGAAVNRMANPNAYKNIGPTTVAASAQTAGPAPVDPEEIERQRAAWTAAHPAPKKRGFLSKIGGALGGIAGTALGGPLGGKVGSKIGGALGGKVAGGGKAPPAFDENAARMQAAMNAKFGGYR